MYDHYLKSIEATRVGESYDSGLGTIDEFNDSGVQDQLELVIKKYPARPGRFAIGKPKTGISVQTHEFTPEDKFFMYGPFGKGFNLTPKTSSKSYMIIVGGIGILPFIDLIAFITRKAIAANSDSNAIFKDEDFSDLNDDFHLTLKAYFPKKKDAVAVEMCQGAHDLCEKAGHPEWFRFEVFYTREEGGKSLRWPGAVDMMKSWVSERKEKE